jgi:DNA processing protein
MLKETRRSFPKNQWPLWVPGMHPTLRWSLRITLPGLPARNPIIYGLASEIFVAESSEKGGTWSGVMDGLRKNRTIYVRKTDEHETNANNLLISKGAIPVDLHGQIVKEYDNTTALSNTPATFNDPGISEEQLILDLLTKGSFSAKEIIHQLGLSVPERQLIQHLKDWKDIITLPTKPVKFTHRSRTQQQISMFE